MDKASVSRGHESGRNRNSPVPMLNVGLSLLQAGHLGLHELVVRGELLASTTAGRLG